MGGLESTTAKDQFKVTKYVIMGLNSYNKYLQRRLNLRINHTERIYSQVAVDEKRNIEALCDSFLTDFYCRNCVSFPENKKDACPNCGSKIETTDQFTPLIYLSTSFKATEGEAFLVKEPLYLKIKDLSAFLIPIIAVTVSIYGLLLRVLLK